ncbi:MAG TPA: DNA polymerase III subunit beta, partial [Candidatus Paceibacterota bacterium]
THVAQAVVLREDFSQTFKILSLFADKFSQVMVAVAPKEKTLSLSARNTDVGENTTTLKATAEGDSLSMTFNGRYLADGLQGIGGESVKLSFAGPGKPLTLSGASDPSFLYIVMPMNR